MKRFFLSLVTLVLCASAFAQSGRDFYRKYSDEPGVNAVYVSPALFRMLGHIPDSVLGEDYRYLRPIVKSLTGMYILSSDNPSVNDRMYRDITKHLKNNKFELLMEAKDNGGVVRIYTLGDEETVTNFVLYDDSACESNYICIDGVMPRKAIEEAVAAGMK